MSKQKRKLGAFNPEMRDFVDADYLDNLSEEDFLWAKKFYREFYARKFDGKSIHKNKDKTTKDVMRREYRARNDVFNLSKRKGQLEYMDERPIALEEDVSASPNDFEEVFKREGYKGAIERIFTDALNQIDEGVVETKIVLERFYLQRERLRRMENTDKRASKDANKARFRNAKK